MGLLGCYLLYKATRVYIANTQPWYSSTLQPNLTWYTEPSASRLHLCHVEFILFLLESWADNLGEVNPRKLSSLESSDRPNRTWCTALWFP
jgi:hypothetical protein